MNKLNQTGKLVVLAAVVVAIVALVLIFGGRNSAGTPMQIALAPSASSSGSTTPPQAAVGSGNTAPNGTVGKTGGTGATAGISAPKQPAITFIAPVSGDTWKISTQNQIAWSREAGVNGLIELLNASTSRFVGVILNVAGPHQTYYAWNTRDLLQSATSPVKITVTPGRYLISIVFSGNNVPTITSQPITLTN